MLVFVLVTNIIHLILKVVQIYFIQFFLKQNRKINHKICQIFKTAFLSKSNYQNVAVTVLTKHMTSVESVVSDLSGSASGSASGPASLLVTPPRARGRQILRRRQNTRRPMIPLCLDGI